MTGDRVYDPNDTVINWECYAMQEGLSDEELQELIHDDNKGPCPDCDKPEDESCFRYCPNQGQNYDEMEVS